MAQEGACRRVQMATLGCWVHCTGCMDLTTCGNYWHICIMLSSLLMAACLVCDAVSVVLSPSCWLNAG
jgi:hypothetical protein